MSLSTLPLSYCTNVHPGLTVDEVLSGLRTYTGEVRKRLGAPLAAGLWLAQPVIAQLTASASETARLKEELDRLSLVCYTLNAFPYGNFHSERVKETVYIPDWTDESRRIYTQQCASVLAALMPVGVEGSISTVPLGFKDLCGAPDFVDRCIPQIIELARFLNDLHDETGQVIRLAIEPEPLCVLETTPETLAFFEKLNAAAAKVGVEQIVRRHIGVCYDVCHQSVEFEDVAASIQTLSNAQIRINKVHITCAIEVDRPDDPAVRAELARFVEPRYLHQTFGRTREGKVVQVTDLHRAHCDSPPSEFADCPTWRVHFHVPVNAHEVGLLKTTRPDLERALATVAKLEYAPHLEVETYTWGVLPSGEKPALVDGLLAELNAAGVMLGNLRLQASGLLG
jgi:sugar phosphate isomerase/epimerase